MRSLLILFGVSAALFAVASLAGPASTQAAVISFDLSIEFSGGTAPTGTPPWIRATFDDGGGAGSVDMFLEDVNLTGTEFVNVWMFNLDPSLDPTALVFSAPTTTGSFTIPTISTGVNAFMANGDGFFDIKLLFDGTDGAPNRFGSGDAVLYTITGIPSLTASSFNFLSFQDGGQGEFMTAAQVGGIGPNDESGWISPEPATLGLLALGGLALVRRRR